MKVVKIGGMNLEDVDNSNYQVMGTNTQNEILRDIGMQNIY